MATSETPPSQLHTLVGIVSHSDVSSACSALNNDQNIVVLLEHTYLSPGLHVCHAYTCCAFTAGRSRAKRKEREQTSQQELEDLVPRMEALQLDVTLLAARQRAMADLVNHQESHINVLVNIQVCRR